MKLGRSMLSSVLMRRSKARGALHEAFERDVGTLASMLAEASKRGLELVERNRRLAIERDRLSGEIEALTAVAQHLRDRVGELEEVNDASAQRLSLAEYQNARLGEDLDRVERHGVVLSRDITGLNLELHESEVLRSVLEERVSGLSSEKHLVLRELSSFIRELGSFENSARREAAFWSEQEAESARTEEVLMAKLAPVSHPL